MTSVLRPLSVASAVADGITPYVNVRGDEFIQLHQRLGPYAKYLYFNFELNFESHYATEFARNHMYLPLLIVAAYVALVFGTAHYKKDKERHDLRMPLVYWNFLLCVFSFMGALRTVPDLLYRLGSSETLGETICSPSASSWGSGATGLWVMLFVFSKVPELIDTAFITLRKRPLLFLHWYHHVTVCLYCWHSYATEAPQALYFVAMNFSVHAIMYGYYCLMALKIKPPVPPVVITAAQISQMVVGVIVQAGASIKYLTGASCDVNGANVFWGGIMYGSYLFLFGKFAVDRYLAKPKAAKKLE